MSIFNSYVSLPEGSQISWPVPLQGAAQELASWLLFPSSNSDNPTTCFIAIDLNLVKLLIRFFLKMGL